MNNLTSFITNAISFVDTHKAAIGVFVLAFHTVVKGVQDAQKANADKKGADKVFAIVTDVLSYIFGGQRA